MRRAKHHFRLPTFPNFFLSHCCEYFIISSPMPSPNFLPAPSAAEYVNLIASAMPMNFTTSRGSKGFFRRSSWGTHGKDREAFQRLAKALARMDEQDRKLLLSMAQGMARRGQSRDPFRAMRPGVYWRRAAKIEFQTARIQGGQDE